MKALVSIIIPIYNVEVYLTKCINSILRQTYRNIEIILVDDGSRDKSPKICDRYQKKDDRVKVVHCKNGGVSAARNIGIDMAQGEYIMFVDSDDWLPKDAIENLVRGIEKNDADFCYGAIKEIHATKNRIAESIDTVFLRKNAVNELISYLKKAEKAPWAKIYIAKLIKKNSLHFDESVKFGEDTIFLFQYLLLCEKFNSISSIVYFYNRIVPNSASRKQYKETPEWEYRIAVGYETFFNQIAYTDKAKNYVARRFLLSLDGRCREIVKYTQSKQVCVEAVREVCELYKEKILSFAQCPCVRENAELCRVFEIYLDRIAKEDYESLYERIEKTSVADSVEPRYKKYLRKLLIPIKKFLVFGRF